MSLFFKSEKPLDTESVKPCQLSLIRNTGVAIFDSGGDASLFGGLDKTLQDVSQIVNMIAVIETVDTNKIVLRT